MSRFHTPFRSRALVARVRVLCRPALLPILAMAGWTAPAHADLGLSKVIVDIAADAPPRDDIELYNSGTERLYVLADPAKIVDPGLPSEARQVSADPSVTGLLVTPQKLVLEPGERKLLRIASILPRDNAEHVYRVTVKPVAGDVTGGRSGLKVYVGYDVLVLVRPQGVSGELQARRDGNWLSFHNASNASMEIAQGKQCDAAGGNCQTLPANRLYPGADWSVSLPYATPVTYQTVQGGTVTERRW